MAKGSLVLATNQGLLYVLAMVVIGGLVGAGALGYDAVLGFSRSEEWGKGAGARASRSCCSGSWSTGSPRRAAERRTTVPSTVTPDKRQWWRPMVMH